MNFKPTATIAAWISLALASVSRAQQEQSENMEAFRKTAAEAPKGMGTLGDLLKAKLKKG